MKQLLFAMLAAVAVCSLSFAQQEKTIERHIPVKSSQHIELRDFSATEINFKSWDKNEVYISLKIEFESSSHEYEDEYIKKIDIEQDEKDGGLILTLKKPVQHSSFSWSNLLRLRFFSYTSGRISGEIYVPQTNPLKLEANYSKVSIASITGELSLEGKSSTIHLRNCSSVGDIENDYGTTTLEQCGGSLHLTSKSSKITVDTFDGPVNLDADYATVKLYEITKGTEVSSKSATISSEHIGGGLKIYADYSNLTINDVKGFVDVQDQSGTLRVRSVEGIKVNAPYANIEIASVDGKSGKPISIKGQSGKLNLENITGDVSIDDPYSPIELRTIRGNVDVRTRSAKLSADDVIGNLHAQTEYTTFDIGDIIADTIFISDKSSSIELNLRRTPRRVEIRNEYGNVSVHLPESYSGEMNLKVSYGKIKSDLPLDVQELGSSAFFVGKLGDRKNSMAISTSSGNIYLKIRSDGR